VCVCHRPLVVVDRLRSTHNPLLRILVSLCDEVCDPWMRATVVDAILEESEEYLLRLHSDFVWDHVAGEVLAVVVRDALFDVLVMNEETNQTAHRLAQSLWDGRMQEVERQRANDEAVCARRRDVVERRQRRVFACALVEDLLSKGGQQWMDRLLSRILVPLPPSAEATDNSKDNGDNHNSGDVDEINNDDNDVDDEHNNTGND
jgi:hypothetical protein